MQLHSQALCGRASSVAALVILVLAALAGCSEPRPERQRVVLITIDTLRLEDFLGGAGRPSAMPRTLAFVERGLVFEHSFAATSTTQPTHASLMTGLHPWEHGVTRNGYLLEEGLETVAERLRDAGWGTYAVVSSFPLERRFGFAQGFEVYEDSFDRSNGQGSWRGQPLQGRAFYSLARRTTGRALAQLDAEPFRDQFLWVHYFDPHCPYGNTQLAQGRPAPAYGLFDAMRLREEAARQPPGLERMIARARKGYAQDLGFLDFALARLLARLEADADRFETHVVIVGDHGESFGEDGSFGHGTRLTPSQIQVPLAVVSPRARPQRRADASGSVDVFATLLDLAGLPAPSGRGRSLLDPPVPPGGAAFGMRQAYRGVQFDQRKDGSVRRISEPSYFAFLDGRLLTGAPDGPLFTPPHGPLEDEALEAQARALFAGFAARIEQGGARELDDADTLQALGALGYAR